MVRNKGRMQMNEAPNLLSCFGCEPHRLSSPSGKISGLPGGHHQPYRVSFLKTRAHDYGSVEVGHLSKHAIGTQYVLHIEGFYISVCFSETKCHCAALADRVYVSGCLELVCGSSRLCLLSAGIIGTCHHTWFRVSYVSFTLVSYAFRHRGTQRASSGMVGKESRNRGGIVPCD